MFMTNFGDEDVVMLAFATYFSTFALINVHVKSSRQMAACIRTLYSIRHIMLFM